MKRTKSFVLGAIIFMGCVAATAGIVRTFWPRVEVNEVVNTRVVRDSILVIKEVVKWVKVKPDRIVDTVLVFTKDTMSAFLASTTKIDEKDTVIADYISPVPLSAEGFFNITLKRAPAWKYMDSIFVNREITRTVYHPDLAWCIVSAAVGVAAGVIIANKSGGY